ncbi:hypothetical protein SAMN05421823_106123 [Catalinimonas alkaloidigena]|uniref:Por secretion system C-terminal sorting domain-containing protein n=1 Tax=Catalinimonas alkaloidigena TaxID=1075417 RepID=A0A1G9KD07_9BACT|nr:hypothetical protein [Catalinimonas alkaloidigena]SDL47506.1 hypothetical protein SAMN05421823_106123 [Catalinimonas alkaloidigena]
MKRLLLVKATTFTLFFNLNLTFSTHAQHVPETAAASLVGAQTLTLLSDVVASVTNFQARTDGKEVRLTWATPPRVRLSHFVLERSQDGLQYDPVMEVRCQDKPQAGATYQTTDRHPWAGRSYYRLRIVQPSASSSFSRPVTAYVALQDLTLSPNPWSGCQPLTIRASLPETPFWISFHDLHGRHVCTIALQDAQVIVPREHFTPGLYHYRIYSSLEVLGQGKWKVE